MYKARLKMFTALNVGERCCNTWIQQTTTVFPDVFSSSFIYNARAVSACCHLKKWGI